MSQTIKVVTTKLPTYLTALLLEESNIQLVFQEIKLKSHSQSSNESLAIKVSDDSTELELTGSPLETDLAGDDTVCSAGTWERPPSWSREEAQQFPLKLLDARRYINSQMMLKKAKSVIYVVCDGKDGQHIVVSGANANPHRISRVLVHVLPCCYENDAVTTIEFMKKDHLKSVRQNAEINISTKNIYNLFGYDLNNSHSLQNTEYNGNISVEMVTEERERGSQSVSMKMNLQVIVGYCNSPLVDIWEELCTIQSYIKQLESKELSEFSVINPDNLDPAEITSTISDLMSNVSILKMATSENINLKNMRDYNVLDKLWMALKHCRTLSDLRDCFYFFFEELAERQPMIHLNEDKSTIGDIVKGVINGRVAVPTLSFSQSLELLIELGLEKLKLDYVALISRFYNVGKQSILEVWSELFCENSVMTSKSSQRKTRISINPKTTITDLSSNKIKLTYLDSLHKISEFMFLYKENLSMLEECFDSYCKKLCHSFVVKFPKIIQSCDLKQPRLCRFSFDISASDGKILIKDNDPVAFSVKLESRIQHSEVVTVFHFSQHSIFPPSIFEDYEIQIQDRDVRNLYVTKMVNYIALC